VVSKCLQFAACRYNGQMLNDPVVALLKEHVEFLPVCAECEIGLGVPREPIRIVQQGNELRLLQPATGHDATAAMLACIARDMSFSLFSIRAPPRNV